MNICRLRYWFHSCFENICKYLRICLSSKTHLLQCTQRFVQIRELISAANIFSSYFLTNLIIFLLACIHKLLIRRILLLLLLQLLVHFMELLDAVWNIKNKAKFHNCVPRQLVRMLLQFCNLVAALIIFFPLLPFFLLVCIFQGMVIRAAASACCHRSRWQWSCSSVETCFGGSLNVTSPCILACHFLTVRVCGELV